MLWALPRSPGAFHQVGVIIPSATGAAVRPIPAPFWEACPWAIGIVSLVGAKVRLLCIQHSTPFSQGGTDSTVSNQQIRCRIKLGRDSTRNRSSLDSFPSSGLFSLLSLIEGPAFIHSCTMQVYSVIQSLKL